MNDLGDSILKKDWVCFKEWFARKADVFLLVVFIVSAIIPYGIGVWALFALDSWWLYVFGAFATCGVLLPISVFLDKVSSV